MNISKQAVLDVLDGIYLDNDPEYLSTKLRTEIIHKINAIPSISDGWISVETGRPPFAQFILTWDGQSIIYRALSRGHDLMPLDEFKERTKITHWLIPSPPTK